MTTIKSIGVPGFVLITLGLALSGFIAYLFTTDRGRDLRHNLSERTTELAKTARRAMPHLREMAHEGPINTRVSAIHDPIPH